MPIEPELTDLLDLLSEVSEQLRGLEHSEADDGVAVAGASPRATENRAIATARATLARTEARQMREGLAELRVRARRMAEVVRGLQAGHGTPRADDPADRRAALAAVVRGLADTDDRAEMLEVLLSGALAVLPGDGWAGVCARRSDGTVVCEASTHPVIGELLSAEGSDGGPVSEVLGGVESVCVPEVGVERRWPELIALMGARGVGSVLVRGFPARRLEPGLVLVVAAADPVPADAPGWRAVDTLADHATIALAGAMRAAGLERALDSRDVIGQAKGILVHRDGLDPEQAFDLLVAASQNSNIKLYDVAAWLVDEVRDTETAPPSEADGRT